MIFRKHKLLALIAILSGVGFWLPAQAVTIPQNKVHANMDGFVLTGTYSENGGQPSGAGTFKNGNVGAYPESSCVPALIEVKNNDNQDGDIEFYVVYDYTKNGNATEAIGIMGLEAITLNFMGSPATADNLDDLTFTKTDFSSVTGFESTTGTVSAFVAGPYSGDNGNTDTVADTDEQRHYNVVLQNVPQGETVYVLACGRLGTDASEFPGSSLSARTGGAGGGGGSMPILGSALLQLPSLTIQKVVADGNATPDMWNFNVSPYINGLSSYSIADGESSVTINNIDTNGTYFITEGSGPDGYSFAYGQGTNCDFAGATASTTLYAAKPQMTATCIFTNSMEPIIPPATTGTLIIVKNVINDNNGNLTSSDFELSLQHSDGGTTTTQSFQGSASGTEFVLEAGTYNISEATSTEYTANFSADCFGSLAVGETKTCTVTNDDIYTPPEEAPTGTLTVIKQVHNLNESDLIAGDFTLKIHLTTSSTTSTIFFPGSENGTVNTLEIGEYSVDEDSVEGYYSEYEGDCSGYLAEGDEKICTVHNYEYSERDSGRLIVIKNVINDNGLSATSSDFIIDVSYTTPEEQTGDLAYAMAFVSIISPQMTTTSFPGNASGTEFIVGPGEYSVTERTYDNYDTTYSEGCSGTISARQTITCTITNNDKQQGGGGSSGGGGTSGGGGSSSGSGSTFAGFLDPPQTATPPAPRVLGEEDVAPLCKLTEIEALYVSSIINEVLGHLGIERNITMEEYFNVALTPRVLPTSLDGLLLAAVQNFVNYGTGSNIRLGQGERAGVINSFRAVYGRMPINECDWQNAIKIANTTMPLDLAPERETQMLTTFERIYGRKAILSDDRDIVAVKVMSYGIRPQIRDLSAEDTAIGVFERIFGKKPETASEWDANRAIAYSGIAHSLLSRNLTNSASRMMSIRVNNEPVR